MVGDTGFEPVVTDRKSVALPDLANPLIWPPREGLDTLDTVYFCARLHQLHEAMCLTTIAQT